MADLLNVLLIFTLLKVIWSLINLTGLVLVTRSLLEANKNLTYLRAAGLNSFLRIEAESSVTDEKLRLTAVLISTVVGFSSFVLGPPIRLIGILAAIGLVAVTGIAVLNSYRQLRKIRRMLAYQGIDTSEAQPDYYKE